MAFFSLQEEDKSIRQESCAEKDKESVSCFSPKYLKAKVEHELILSVYSTSEPVSVFDNRSNV